MFRERKTNKFHGVKEIVLWELKPPRYEGMRLPRELKTRVGLEVQESELD
jgi:hypothetical protein